MSEWAAKRFWKDVTVDCDDAGFSIRLDARPVRTPAKKALIVPTETMANQIADEWAAQADKINPLSMPWTRSANVAIDKVAVQASEVKAHLAAYADTDLLLYRAEAPQALIQRQHDAWNPVLEWVEARYGARLRPTTGVMPVSQDAVALARLVQAMEDMSSFRLTGFYDMVSLTGSFSLALACAEHHITPQLAWRHSRVDEDWQIDQWGDDEEAKLHAEVKKTAFLHATEFFDAS